MIFSLLVLATIGTLTPSAAAQRQMGGAGITVFADSNFRGRSATYREDVLDLAQHGLNDRITSLRVAPGEQWEVCEHSNYQGRCVVVSGDEPDLRRNSWSDVISSFRRVRSGAVRPPAGSDWYIVLFDQPSYRGNPTNYKGAASYLSRRVQSVTIGRGVWELCEGANFSGRCVTLDRSVLDLGSYGMRNRVGSVRPAGSGASGGTRPWPPPQGDWYIVLYNQPNYRGTPTTFKGSTSHLSSADSRAQSVTIGSGVWELCQGANFSGRCVTLDRSVPDLGAYGMRNRVGSVRPVSPQAR